jgi:hypothetical protein
MVYVLLVPVRRVVSTLSELAVCFVKPGFLATLYCELLLKRELPPCKSAEPSEPIEVDAEVAKNVNLVVERGSGTLGILSLCSVFSKFNDLLAKTKQKSESRGSVLAPLHQIL